ncbi:MAG TPA: pyrroline-5-carboxylate reductase [Armatimonadota bacterium]|nr:pyrroline-5-carboxylate reductase [Armatimonadota bacterium]
MAAKKIAFIGTGFMGEALLRGILKAELVKPAEIAASDVNTARLEELSRELGIVAAADNAAAVSGAETILLAVKPQVLPGVLAGLAPHVTPDQLVLSIAAGVPLATLQDGLGAGVPVIRIMPNLLATVGAAATALAPGAHATQQHIERAQQFFGAVGTTVCVAENLMNAVTALSGSGPAYVCLVIEALADGGVEAGLSRAVAQQLAAQTVLGTARLILETGQHPAQVKDRVSSPAGTTIAGVRALERAGIRSAMMDAVEAAAKRSEELGRAAGK